MLTPQVTIVASMFDLLGAIQPNSTLTAQLCGYGSQVPRVAGTALIAKTSPLPVKAGVTGFISETIWGNDVITPAGTYYTFAVTDDRGNTIQLNAYQFAGVGTFDLSNTALYDPQPPAIFAVNPVLLNPPGSALQTINGSITINGNLIVTGTINGGGAIYTVPYAASVTFNGNLGGSFKLTLSGDVVSSFVSNMAGKLIVPIRIIQDAVGGRNFAWPANVRGHGDISPAPNARSVQLFAVDTDGSMDGASLMQYS
jgi:hypothetical protein